MLAVALFFPLWRIDFEAPQYPEGLYMLIYPNKMAGDVQTINGLNHYIGMKTIHEDSFVELKVLPYLIGGFSIFFFLTAFFARKTVLYILTVAFLLFGVVSMVDFYLWEYDYGHNLDPKAAIKVPGAEYQPPLIGYKLLLNFGVMSLPDVGGVLITVAGLLLIVSIVMETNLLSRFIKSKNITRLWLLLGVTIFLSSCSTSDPETILLNKDNCAFCKMTISDGHFGTEFITTKGRVYKFDDIKCMLTYSMQNKDVAIKSFWVHDFPAENTLIPAEKSHFVASESLSSPMGGNIAAFKDETTAKNIATKYNVQTQTWEQILNSKTP